MKTIVASIVLMILSIWLGCYISHLDIQEWIKDAICGTCIVVFFIGAGMFVLRAIDMSCDN